MDKSPQASHSIRTVTPAPSPPSPSPVQASSSPSPPAPYTRPSKLVISLLVKYRESHPRHHPINYTRKRSVILGLSSRQYVDYERFNSRLTKIQNSPDSYIFKVPSTPPPPQATLPRPAPPPPMPVQPPNQVQQFEPTEPMDIYKRNWDILNKMSVRELLLFVDKTIPQLNGTPQDGQHAAATVKANNNSTNGTNQSQ